MVGVSFFLRGVWVAWLFGKSEEWIGLCGRGEVRVVHCEEELGRAKDWERWSCRRGWKRPSICIRLSRLESLCRESFLFGRNIGSVS